MKYSIGVDIGGTSIKVGLVSQDGKVVDRFSYVIKKNISQEQIIEELSFQINDFIDNNKVEIKTIGIGCAGAIDSTKGICEYSNNLNWYDLPITTMMEKITGKRCYIGNDANVAALGEAKYGSGASYNSFILLTLGTGVGGGLFLDGKLYEGVDGKGAEIGHMSIDKFNGRICTCGEKGCFETYASATALINDAKKALELNKDSLMLKMVNGNQNLINAKTVFDAKDQGDPTAIEVVNNYIMYLAEGILNLINIFRPNAILLSGGISNQREKLIQPLKKYIQEKHYGFGTVNNKKIDILIASLGADTGILGAAALAFEHEK